MEGTSISQERAMYVKEIKFKKDTIAALQYNIQMHYLGMEREDAQTSWSKEGALLSVIQLTARLIEIGEDSA